MPSQSLCEVLAMDALTHVGQERLREVTAWQKGRTY